MDHPFADWAPEILEAVPDAVLVLDAERAVAWLNRAAERLLGTGRAEVVGRPAGDVLELGGDALERHGKAVPVRVRRADGRGVPAQALVLRRAQGASRWALVVRPRSTAAPELQRLLADAERLAGLGSFSLDLETLRATWSDGMYRMLGFEPGEVPPDLALIEQLVHPDDRPRLQALLQAIRERPGTISAEPDEYRAVRPDGSQRRIRILARVDCAADGRAVRWLGTAQDVTDRWIADRELQAHYAVGQALREWESVEDGIMALIRRLATALEAPVGGLWTCNAERELLTCRAFWHEPEQRLRAFERVSRRLTFAPGEGVPGEAWLTLRPVAIEDVEHDPRFLDPEIAVTHGVRSCIAFPAVGPDGPLAVLVFYSFDVRRPSERMLRTLEGIGGQLGRFLARNRAQLEQRRLSGRELDVLRLAAEGRSGPEIAEVLVVSPSTVKTHFEHIYDKLGVGDRAGAVAQALRLGLIR